jgi:hypothetical protein
MGKKTSFSRKELKALYATYGADDHYNSDKFQLRTRNLTASALLQSDHHCERCNAKMSNNCYRNYHYAYCPHWVTQKGRRERCEERFALRSDACGNHHKVQGYKGPLYCVAGGGDVDLTEVDDPDPLNFDEPDGDDDDDGKAVMTRVDELE